MTAPAVPAPAPDPRSAPAPAPATEAEAASPASSVASAAPAVPGQARNPLHGVTLEAMVTALSEHYGWAGLGERIPVRCFNVDPSVSSSLRFLRKTPWARDKVEGLYLYMLRDLKRSGGARGG
ncbi:VF530 family protein [Hydrogenophaga sp. PAMC20947]|uniref:VF530 family protein n=1 Tax=Hydrogenophaga sp. PAMC20947 TaxID=2565558 RepID=UPI00109DCB9F|nr:VF530 family protein [Hydrogenophaga sp. PAMC20947]QCB47997.1 DUF2132 domain-containing protein [Hydrogenophaga sp. PAMC20947]